MHDPDTLHTALIAATMFVACAIVGNLVLIAHDKHWKFSIRMVLILMIAVALFGAVIRFWTRSMSM